MGRMVLALDPLLDAPPVDTAALGKGSLLQQLRNLRSLKPLLQAGTSGMPGSPESKGCLSAPGVGDAEPPQEPQLGWQALAGSLTLVLMPDLQSWAPAGSPGTAVQSHTLSTRRAGAGAAAAPLLRGAHSPHLQGVCWQWRCGNTLCLSCLPGCCGSSPPKPGMLSFSWARSWITGLSRSP